MAQGIRRMVTLDPRTDQLARSYGDQLGLTLSGVVRLLVRSVDDVMAKLEKPEELNEDPDAGHTEGQ